MIVVCSSLATALGKKLNTASPSLSDGFSADSTVQYYNLPTNSYFVIVNLIFWIDWQHRIYPLLAIFNFPIILYVRII